MAMVKRVSGGRTRRPRVPRLALLLLAVLGGPPARDARAEPLDLREVARRTLEEQPRAFREPEVEQQRRSLRFRWPSSAEAQRMRRTSMGTLLVAQCRVEVLRRRARARRTEWFWEHTLQVGEHEIGRALQELRSARSMPETTRQRRAEIALRRFEDAVVEDLWDFARREGLRLELAPDAIPIAYDAFQLTARTNPPGGTVDLVVGWDYYLALLDGREPFEQATSIADGNTSPLQPGGYWFRVRRSDGTVYGPERRLVTDPTGGGPFGLPPGPP